MSNIAWDSQNYSKHFSYVADYGQPLIDMIDKREGMTCLDLGCGNGRLTEKLKEAGLDVTGMDDSATQIQKAKEDHNGIRFVQGNACDFSLAEPVDAVFSNDVFHWIRMFVKAPFDGIAAAEAEAIIREAVEELRPRLCEDGVWYADYVRLRCKAMVQGC